MAHASIYLGANSKERKQITIREIFVVNREIIIVHHDKTKHDS